MKTCRKICSECPFGKTSAKGWLGPHTIEEILHTQQMELPFSCHMQRDEDSTEEQIEDGELHICRGFLASASASCKLFGQHPTYGKEMAELQNEITNADKKQVLTRWEFTEHHTINIPIS